jgi:Spy/CpxP family protein refolding chaperone
MKKIIVTVFALAVATLATQAQDKPEGRHDRSKGGHHQEFVQKLNLSEDQKAKFKSLNEDYRKQLQELKKNDDITVKDQKTKMKALRDDHKSRMQSLLTSDQKAQIQKMKEEHKVKREADSKERMEKMKTRLNLTDDQVAKMKAQRADMSAKFKALHENKSLSDDQRKEQFKELRKQQKESMKSILTDEQMKKMKERKPRKAAAKNV